MPVDARHLNRSYLKNPVTKECLFSFLILYIYYNKIFIKNQLWGTRRDSNPQHSEPQSDALPLRYSHHMYKRWTGSFIERYHHNVLPLLVDCQKTHPHKLYPIYTEPTLSRFEPLWQAYYNQHAWKLLQLLTMSTLMVGGNPGARTQIRRFSVFRSTL